MSNSDVKISEYEDSEKITFRYDRQGAVDYAHFFTDGQGKRRGKYIRFISGAQDSFLSWANPEYFFYIQNCSAFLSQCLHSGGKIPMTKRWYQLKETVHGSFHQPGTAKNRRILSFFLIIYQRIRKFLRLDSWNISEVWREAEDNFRYFSNPAEGFITGNYIIAETAEDIPGIVKDNNIRPGDVVYLQKKGLISHCLLVTKVSSSEIYYCANRYTRYDMELSAGLKKDEDTKAFILCMKDCIEISGGEILNE